MNYPGDKTAWGKEGREEGTEKKGVRIDVPVGDVQKGWGERG